MRALVLAALICVVPITAAYAGDAPEPKYPPPTHTTPETRKPPETLKPPQTVRERGGGGLAETGSDSTPLVWAGIAALSVGAVLVIGARRRASVRR